MKDGNEMNMLYVLLFIIAGSFVVFFVLSTVIVGKDRTCKICRKRKKQSDFTDNNQENRSDYLKKYEKKEVIPKEEKFEKVSKPYSQKEAILKSMEEDFGSDEKNRERRVEKRRHKIL